MARSEASSSPVSKAPSEAPRKGRKALPRFVDAADYLAVLWRHLTEGLCEEIFRALRERERERKWTIFTLMQFWVALLHSGPEMSQTQAVSECDRGHPLYPVLTATPESFFERVQSLGPRFFSAIFTRVTRAFLQEISALPVRFASGLSIPAERFSEIYTLDASRLDPVAHRLKILRRTTRAVIPGSIEALYDVRRGVIRALHFDPDGSRAEYTMAEELLGDIPAGSLLVLDRLYATPTFIGTAQMCGMELVARYKGGIKRREVRLLRRVRRSNLSIDDVLIELGTTRRLGKADTPAGPVLVRYVEIETQHGGATHTLKLITTVLDPERLGAEEMAELYGYRWTIERMFLTMKSTLHLERLYNSTPAAVGQQLYATALLYNALRLAQAQLALKLEVEPERLSPEKLFPRLMQRLEQRTWIEAGVIWHETLMRATNPSIPRYDPEALARSLDHNPRLRLDVHDILLERRKEGRKRRRYCEGRHMHTSFAKLSGGKRYLKT
ncbi:MAG TPA: IS4 family transposase [Gemmatimonadaceae bacterium]